MLELCRCRLTNGCLTLTESLGTLVTPVFPKSQTERAELPGILMFRGRTYRVGDSLEVAGGSSPGDELPHRCPGEAWIVYPDL